MNQQGDVLLCQTNDLGDIEVEDGIVTMSGGLETAVYLSILGGNIEDDGLENNQFTWWGNLMETDSAFKYVSETQRILTALPAVSRNLLLVEQAILRDLQWMLDNKVASNIAVTVTLPQINRVGISVDIEADGLEKNFNFTENWRAA